MESFARVRSDRMEISKSPVRRASDSKSLDQLPELKLITLHRLTDDTGMLQHSIFTIPNRERGYTTDDNARALIFSVLLGHTMKHSLASSILRLRFRGSPLFSRSWNMPLIRRRVDSGISFAMIAGGTKLSVPKTAHGRALWALGTVLGRSQNPGLRGAAGRLFEFSLPAVVEFSSPRAWAYTLLGVQEYLDFLSGRSRCAETAIRTQPGDCSKCMSRSAGRIGNGSRMFWLMAMHRLPQALLLVGSACSDDRMISAGLESLDWLSSAATLRDQPPLCADRFARLLSPEWREGPFRSAAD